MTKRRDRYQARVAFSEEQWTGLERCAASDDRTPSNWVKHVVMEVLREQGYLPEPGMEDDL